MTLLEIYQYIAYEIIWNPFLPFLLFGAGIIAGIFHKFIQFRMFSYNWKELLGRRGTTGLGIISRLSAFFTTIGCVVGLGNIAGVSSAMASGGPGAIFWMWLAALTGMGLKPAECTLAAYTRMVLPDGRTYGGPTWYMEYLEKVYRIPKKIIYILVGTFVISFLISVLFPTYAYTILEMTQATFPFLTPEQVIAFEVIITAIAAFIWYFEIRGVAAFCSAAVPFMLILYVIMGSAVLVNYASNIPQGISDIFYYAFNPAPAIVGGFAGASVFHTVRVGVARAVYSNEAGWGTSPHYYATAKGLRHPGDVLPPSSLDVFIDTIVICTFTGLIIASSGEWKTGIGGFTAVLTAFKRVWGEFAVYPLFFTTFLFMYTTYISGPVSTVSQLRYLTLYKAKWPIPRVDKFVKAYMLIIYYWPSVALASYFFLSGYTPAEVWVTADLMTGLALYPNLISVILLAPAAGKLLKEYESKAKKGELKEEMAAEPWRTM
ncbi:MAG: alanine:cation symporter family protein [Desulfurococcaceae archaeon]